MRKTHTRQIEIQKKEKDVRLQELESERKKIEIKILILKKTCKVDLKRTQEKDKQSIF